MAGRVSTPRLKFAPRLTSGWRGLRNYWDHGAGRELRTNPIRRFKLCVRCENGDHTFDHNSIMGCEQILRDQFICSCMHGTAA